MSKNFLDYVFGSTYELINIDSIVEGFKHKDYTPFSDCFFKKADSYTEIGCRALSVVSAPIASAIAAAGFLMVATYNAVAGIVNCRVKHNDKSTKNFQTAAEYFKYTYSFLWFALISALTNLIDTIGVLGLKLKEDFTSTAESTASKHA